MNVLILMFPKEIVVKNHILVSITVIVMVRSSVIYTFTSYIGPGTSI